MSKGTQWIDRAVKCPFYRSAEDKQLAVKCEGPVDGALLSIKFKRREDFERHFNGWCCGNYEACELFRVIASAYDF